MIKHYKDLIVWQKAIKMVLLVYKATKSFPKDELYGLTSQLRRAAVSVPSNISEGQARRSSREFRRFLTIAKGSMAEIETQLIIAEKLNFLQESHTKEIMTIHDEISKMLSALISKLSSHNSSLTTRSSPLAIKETP